MSNFWRKTQIIFSDSTLRNRVLFVLGALLLFRLLAAVPIPGIDPLSLERLFSSNQFLGLLNIFTGGGLSSLSIVMLGVGPYITASIIMQLMTVMVPRVKAMYHEEGSAGKKKFTQISRVLTVPLAALQGLAFLMLLQRQGVLGGLGPTDMVLNILIITAGAVLMMWIGELMSEFGVGNGVSILIFAGIVATVPQSLGQLLFTYDPTQIPTYLGFIVAAVLIVLGVVIMNEAARPIPITYSKEARGFRQMNTSTNLPLRLNQAGVMPIIFALSILLFPQMIVGLLAGVGGTGFAASLSNTINAFLNNLWLYGISYFVLVFLFTFFYTAITFDVDAVASNLRKSGAFIPGVRPGQSTTDYITRILTRITFVGGIFLGVIAILPIIMQALTGIQTLAIGGTALLIVVAVIIDLVKQLDAQVTMREY